MGNLSIEHLLETYARHGHGHIQQIQIAQVNSPKMSSKDAIK
jgi:hypothetical protein